MIRRLSSSRVSLVDAINQLEIANQALSQAQQFQKDNSFFREQISDLQQTCASFVTSSQLISNIEQIRIEAQSTISQQFKAIQDKILAEMSRIPNTEDIEAALSAKASSVFVENLTEKVKETKDELSNLKSELSFFKTKTALKLRDNTSQALLQDLSHRQDNLSSQIDQINNLFNDPQNPLQQICTEILGEYTENKNLINLICKCLISINDKINTLWTKSNKAKKYAKDTRSSFENSIASLKQQIESLVEQHKDFLNSKPVEKTPVIEFVKVPDNDLKQEVINTCTDLINKNLQDIHSALNDQQANLQSLQNKYYKNKAEISSIKNACADKFEKTDCKIDTINQQRNEFKDTLNKIFEAFPRIDSRINSVSEDLFTEIANIKEPMMDLISNQNRQIQTLEQEIKRIYNVDRDLAEKESPYFAGFTSRPSTPSVSLKHKYNIKNHKMRTNTPIQIDQNWLKHIEDGQLISLPRVKSRKIEFQKKNK